MIADAEHVLDFWFGAAESARETVEQKRKLWFAKSQANDQAVIDNFADTLRAASAGELEHWSNSARGRLALIIVFDQFPHHIHRDQPLAFATDAQALALTLEALARNEDQRLTPIERIFLYLPLEHAESNEMQALSVSHYEILVHDAESEARTLFEDFLDYARRHQDVVARFGRFPHRNTILGRTSTPEELEFLKQPGSRF